MKPAIFKDLEPFMSGRHAAPFASDINSFVYKTQQNELDDCYIELQNTSLGRTARFEYFADKDRDAGPIAPPGATIPAPGYARVRIWVDDSERNQWFCISDQLDTSVWARGGEPLTNSEEYIWQVAEGAPWLARQAHMIRKALELIVLPYLTDNRFDPTVAQAI